MRSGVFYFVLFALVIAADGCSAHARAAATQPVDSTGLHVPNGFLIETIASIPSARELVALPDGNLIVGTLRHDVYVVPDAEGLAVSPRVFATLDDDRAAGIAFSTSRSEIYVATTNHIWVLAYPGKANAPNRPPHRGRPRWRDRTGDGRRRSYDDVHSVQPAVTFTLPSALRATQPSTVGKALARKWTRREPRFRL